MKAILISIHSRWVELILNLIKKDEIRKGTALYKAINKLIDEQGVAPMLIYCTKDTKKYHCFKNNSFNYNKYSAIPIPTNKEWYKSMKHIQLLNGKVVAQFNATADLLELKMIEGGLFFAKPDKEVIELDLNENAQIDNWQLLHYTGEKLGTEITDIHINNLEIFDEPKEIGEFYKVGYKNSVLATKKCILYSMNREEIRKHKTELNLKINNEIAFIKDNYKLNRAPQSWCYVEVEDEE